jgi:hypothetical protein
MGSKRTSEEMMTGQECDTENTNATKKTCTAQDAIQSEYDRVRDAMPDARVDFIGDHLSANAISDIYSNFPISDIYSEVLFYSEFLTRKNSGTRFQRMLKALKLARIGRTAIYHRFKIFACELVDVKCTAAEPELYTELSKKMDQPVQKLRERIAKGGVRFDSFDSVGPVQVALYPHCRAMLGAYVKSLADLVCDAEWDSLTGPDIKRGVVENDLRKHVHLAEITFD